jgi:hypothetical protein
MDIGGLPLHIEFPGPAGDYQRAGKTVALIRELGDNYAEYHAFLAEKASGVTSLPDPNEFHGDRDAYARACKRVMSLVQAEAVLRRCRAFRKLGRRLDEIARDEPALVTADRRLNSVEPSAA